MKKTKDPIYIPLSEQALKWLPDRNDKDAEEKVFFIPRVEYVNPTLAKWAETARVKKRMTFHCARHGFATLALCKGMPIESVSRILGHTNIVTTQIYAKITTQKLDNDLTMFGNKLSKAFNGITMA